LSDRGLSGVVGMLYLMIVVGDLELETSLGNGLGWAMFGIAAIGVTHANHLRSRSVRLKR
jgi:hypothetical protein